jgi:hypothetical protein
MDAKFTVLSAAGSRLSSPRSQRRHFGLADFARRPEFCPAVLRFPGIKKYPMLAWIRRWFAQATDQAVIRVVATVVGLLAYIVWGGYSYFHPGTEASVACKSNCATEFSSRHRAE